MLERFLLIIYDILNRSANLFSRNHPTLCFWLRREGRQMPNAKQLIYQTGKISHQRFSIKMLSLKILQYSQENTCMKLLRTPILKNICIWLLLNWLYEVIIWNFVSLSHLKPSRLCNIIKIPLAFKPNFKQNSVHMPSIYLTPTLSFEPRFCMFIINSYYTKIKCL